MCVGNVAQPDCNATYSSKLYKSFIWRHVPKNRAEGLLGRDLNSG